MSNLINRFRDFLGVRRLQSLAILLGITGITSFILGFSGTQNAVISQNILAIIFVLGASWIIGSRFSNEDRIKWLSILAPAFGLVVLGLLFFPQYQMAMFGAALGWVVVGAMIFGRNQTPIQYRDAIKAMRKGDYKTAVDLMDSLIRKEPNATNHYRFRAELLRLWGKLGRARRDYVEMVERSTDDITRAVGYNGIAEVDLQAGKYADALIAAQKAYELAPDQWVASYNLGMIQDRMGDSVNVLSSLDQSLKSGVPDSRHRLLIHVWRLRALLRLKRQDEAQSILDDLKREQAGFKEWQKILADEQAAVLREVLDADVRLSERILNGATLQQLSLEMA